MDNRVMNNISYGLYILTASNGGQSGGCVINTLQQVTSSPNRVAVTVNKANFTGYMIRQSGAFNVSMIDESGEFSLFEHFGFTSGRWSNKFYKFVYKRAENGIPFVPEHTCAYLSGQVVQTVDLGTHTMFIADVTAGEVLSDKPAMTYAYYHKNVKPKPAAAAAVGEVGERWICNICGYIYEGHLPDDFVCPLCKHGAEDFSRIDENGNVTEQDKPAQKPDSGKGEQWVCNVCGYIHEGPLPEDFVCPVCDVGAENFSRVE